MKSPIFFRLCITLLLASPSWLHALPPVPGERPGILVEMESGEGHSRFQTMRQASGGRILSNFDKESRVTLTFELPRNQPTPRLYHRYNNGMSGAGALDVYIEGPGFDGSKVGTLEQPVTGSWSAFEWSSISLPPMQAGTYRIRFQSPPNRSTGGLDAALLIQDVWDGAYIPPSTLDSKSQRLMGAGMLRSHFTTQWIGDTFNGAGGTGYGTGGNGQGRWVQNFAREVKVTPQGTVIGAADWDEAGRCVSLYRDGDVNVNTLQARDGRRNAWGWGTASEAVAFDESHLYVLNTKGRLLVFEWNPLDIHVHRNIADYDIGEGVALDAHADYLVVLRKDGTVEQRPKADPMTVRKKFQVADARKVAVDSSERLWLIVKDRVVAYNWEGRELVAALREPGRPMDVSWTPQGTLLVADDGPRQQVLEYSVEASRASLTRAYGQEGGMAAGIVGKVADDKFFALRGAGRDTKGNLYVVMSRSETVVRAFNPEGGLLWTVESYPFTDSYDFDREANGTLVYGVDEIMEVGRAGGPGPVDWSLRSLHIDPRQQGDSRLDSHSGARGSAFFRRIGERRLLFTQGMYAGPGKGRNDTGYQMYVFHKPEDQHSVPAGQLTGQGWAWNVDDSANVWEGNSKGGSIQLHRFAGFDGDGMPRFEQREEDRFPRPPGIGSLDRIQYDAANDRMVISGYTKERPSVSWGLVGSILRIYPDWKAKQGRGEPSVEIVMPQDDQNLHPKAWVLEKDYVFVAACKQTQGQNGVIHIFSAETGARAGQLALSDEVGRLNSGYIDIPYAVKALRRDDGRYLVLVEEEWRGRQMLYTWTPPGVE